MYKKVLFILYAFASLIILLFTIQFSMSESQPTVSLRKGDAGVIHKSNDISAFITITKDIDAIPQSIITNLIGVSLPPISTFPTYADFCVTEIILDIKGTYEPLVYLGFERNKREWAKKIIYKVRDICLSEKMTDFDGYEFPSHLLDKSTGPLTNTTVVVNTIEPSNYYPLDTFVLEISTTVSGLVTDKSGNKFTVSRLPFLDGLISVPGWRNRSDNRQVNPPYETQNRQTVHFYRATTQLFLVPILFVSVFVLIAMLLVIEENSSVLEISIGILLGLWGIQDILIPKNMSPTFIQSIILSLYVFLLATIAVRFLLLKPFWNKAGKPYIDKQETNLSDFQRQSDEYISVTELGDDPTTPIFIPKDNKNLQNDKAFLNIITLLLSFSAFLISLLYFWNKTDRK
jgi:hypothetical protein